MKHLLTGLLAINLASLAFSQTAPSLSTADKIAIQTCEASKQEAKKRFDDAEQQELSVLREFQNTHHGWHVNPDTFTVEADPKPAAAAPVPAPKKEVK